MVVNTSDNRWATSNFIVAPTLAEGASYTTIAAALTAASSGNTIFIKPGTYTENLTLKAGVNLVAFSGDGDTPNVTIVGKATATFAGTCTISNIRLQTNSDFFLVVSGSSATIVNLEYCFLNCSNNTGISFTTSSSSAQINVFYCQGNLGTTGISFSSSSSAGTCVYRYCILKNSGASTTVTTASAGTIAFQWTFISSPVSTTGTAAFNSINSNFDSQTQNATCLTIGGSGNGAAANTQFNSGTASAISVSQTLALALCTISSSNANTITGAGTVNIQGVSYVSTSFGTNPTSVGIYTIDGRQYRGRDVNTAPSAGCIGEQIRSFVDFTTPVSMGGSATSTNITSISLTPGIWDVSAIGMSGSGSANTTQMDISISTTSATIAGSYPDRSLEASYASSPIFSLSIPSFRMSLSSTTTVYLVGQMQYAAGTGKMCGRISATRVG